MSYPDNPSKWPAVVRQCPELLNYHFSIRICNMSACSALVGCSFKQRGIEWMLESRLPICRLIVAHDNVQVENVLKVYEKLYQQPCSIMYLFMCRTTHHSILWKLYRYSKLFLMHRRTWYWIYHLVEFMICCWFMDMAWPKCITQPLETWGNHTGTQGLFQVTLSGNINMIQVVLRNRYWIYTLQSMYASFSRSTLCRVLFHMCLQFYFKFLSEVTIKQVFLLVVNFDQRLSGCEIWFWPLSDCPGHYKLYHIVCHNHSALLSSVTTGSIIPFTSKSSDCTPCISIKV